jgi:hypothetical protein
MSSSQGIDRRRPRSSRTSAQAGSIMIPDVRVIAASPAAAHDQPTRSVSSSQIAASTSAM